MSTPRTTALKAGLNPGSPPGLAGSNPASSVPPCRGCGGPHQFDTSIPSPAWNRVIRDAGLPDYLCTSCIVAAFVRAGESFEAELYAENFSDVPVIHVAIGSRPISAIYGHLADEVRRLRTVLERIESFCATNIDSSTINGVTGNVTTLRVIKGIAKIALTPPPTPQGTEQKRHTDCVARFSDTCVWLADGTKIVMHRKDGRTWFEHVPQAVIRPATGQTEKGE